MITACLAYYAETPDTLDRCIRSLPEVVERVVAMEGRWEPFPDLEADPVEDVDILQHACWDQNIELRWSSGRWGSQVEKRSELMQAAAKWGGWLLVIDADEFVTFVDDELLRTGLNETSADVAQVMMLRHPVDQSSMARAIRRLYRASAGVSVRVAHNGYETSDGRFLHGDPAYVKLAEPENMSAALQLGHDVKTRQGPRKLAREVFLKIRAKHRLESWTDERLRQKELANA